MHEENMQIKLSTYELQDNLGAITFSARLKYLMPPKSQSGGHMLNKASHLAGSSLKLAEGAVKGIGSATGSAVKYLVSLNAASEFSFAQISIKIQLYKAHLSPKQ